MARYSVLSSLKRSLSDFWVLTLSWVAWVSLEAGTQNKTYCKGCVHILDLPWFDWLSV